MTATQPVHAPPTKHPWAGGLMVFAAVMLMLSGVLDIFRGIMGIAQDAVFVATPSYVFRFDLTGWGWLHLALGVVAVIVSLGLFQNAVWARVCGVVIAAFVIIANFLTVPYHPVWSFLVIAISGFVIWALCVADGRDWGSASA